MDPGLHELIAHGESTQEVELIIKLKDIAKYPEDISIVSRFGDIATCRLRCGKIKEVWADEQVVSLKAPRLLGIDPEPLEQSNVDHPTFISSAYQRRPDTQHTGKGVVVGIADWGIDFTHPNFLHEDGTTRFLSIWDQSADFHESAFKYGYGRVFSKEEINTALLSHQPFETLGYHPAQGDPLGDGAHGTHVLDIAAGNGSKGQTGVAPEADLVAVHLSSGKIKGLASLGDSVKVLEAIDFIGEVANSQPLVINLSVGQHGGSHQGKSLVEQGMDNFLREQAGRSIIQSTGNYYAAKAHSSGKINQNEFHSLIWRVSDYDQTPNELEVWYPGEDVFEVMLKSPDSETIISAWLGETKDLYLRGEIIGRLYHREREPNTGDNHVDIFLYKNAPTGNWKLTLAGEDIQNGSYHAWIERDSACYGCQSTFRDEDVDPNYTTGTICNGHETIAVGAYNPHVSHFELAPFSSAGPTADGRQKPNLVAPGLAIQAAKSAGRDDLRSSGELTIKSGTSMAAPHVTGTVALILSASDELLTIEKIREQLLGGVSSFSLAESNRIGEGILNIPNTISTPETTENIEEEISLTHQHFIEMEEHNIEETLVPAEKYFTEEDPDEFILDDFEAEDEYEDEFEEEDANWEDDDHDYFSLMDEDDHSFLEEDSELLFDQSIPETYDQEKESDKIQKPQIHHYGPFSDQELVTIFDNHQTGVIGFESDSALNRIKILGRSGERLSTLNKGDIIINRGLGEGKLVFQHRIQEHFPQDNFRKRLNKEHLVKVEGDKWLKIADSRNIIEPNILIIKGSNPATERALAENWVNLKNVAAQVALEEWEKWDFGKKDEGDPNMLPHLKKYWLNLYPNNDAYALDRARKSAADDRNEAFWSAAFISYVMRSAGVGEKFKYSARHWDYANQAKKNRSKNDLDNPFWLYKLDEVKPDIGDLVCRDRSKRKITYDNIQDADDKSMHCDIVVQVEEDKIWLIGGNTSQLGITSEIDRVGQKFYPLDKDGFMKPKNRIFAILKFRPYRNWRSQADNTSPGNSSSDPENPHNINLRKAVRINTLYSRKYGWGAKIQQILQFFSLKDRSLQTFALAVADFQKSKNFPPHQINGILDPKTWNVLRKELNTINDNPYGIDIEKAIRLNAIYSKRYGWGDHIQEIRKFFKLSKASPRIFALAVAGYQKRKKFPSHEVIGILGPKTWDVLRQELNNINDNPYGIDIEKAIRLNDKYSKRYGWGSHIQEIMKFFELKNRTLKTFALAVADFQKSKNFPPHQINGILDSKTWRLIKKEISIKKEGTSNPLNIDLTKAIKYNESSAINLGWSSHLDKIIALLNLDHHIKHTDEKFAIAVANYQEKSGFNKKGIDGIIGPITLNQMAKDLGLDQPLNKNRIVNAVSKAIGKLNFAQKETIVKINRAFEIYGDTETPKLAYILATAWHESRLKPVRECFADTDQEARKCVIRDNRGYKNEINGHVYYGRGFVQLTWEANYREMSNLLNIDFLNNPDLALVPENAAKIIVYGMINGTFTTKKLSNYIQGQKIDFENARQVVNKMDKADLISNYARSILGQLEVF